MRQQLCGQGVNSLYTTWGDAWAGHNGQLAMASCYTVYVFVWVGCLAFLLWLHSWKFYLFSRWNYTVFYPLKFHLILVSDKHGCQGIHCSSWAGAWLLTHSHYSNSVGIEYSGGWGVAWSAAHMGAAKSMCQGGAGMGGGRARGDALHTGCHQCTNWHE